MEQRFVFNDVADLYDQVRPTYPEALFDDVLAATALTSGDSILEIGCGTGQATAGFARRSVDVLALEPGAALLRVARERLAAYANVRFLETTFEAWDVAPGAFKLIAAAQSWHWVARELRFVKAAQALAPGGALAVFGNVPDVPSPLREALDRVYARHAPALGGPPPEILYLPTGPFVSFFDESRLFDPVTHKGYRWSQSHSALSYVELLRSISRYQMLEPARRERLLAAIQEAVEAHGGRFDLGYETHLYLAMRKP